MAPEIVVIGIAALLFSAVLTGCVRRMAIARGLLDIPNARSSHVAVTPRGGGLSFVLAVSAGSSALALLGRIPSDILWVVLAGGGAIALIGLLDDRRPVPARVRFVVHLGAAAAAVASLGAPKVWQLGGGTFHVGWLGSVLETIGIVWTVNLFNFMDGIDGIAASEAACIAVGVAVLALGGSMSHDAALIGVVVGASCAGFLVWNWPPAKIFMGDVGSGYLGYLVGILLIVSIRESPNQLWSGLILGGVFYVDATVTLIRRALRGERVYEAHRSHAYQQLARRWRSHRRVTLAVVALNLLWLLPCAAFAARNPRSAPLIALGALAPVLVAVIAAGAGSVSDDWV